MNITLTGKKQECSSTLYINFLIVVLVQRKSKMKIEQSKTQQKQENTEIHTTIFIKSNQST